MGSRLCRRLLFLSSAFAAYVASFDSSRLVAEGASSVTWRAVAAADTKNETRIWAGTRSHEEFAVKVVGYRSSGKIIAYSDTSRLSASVLPRDVKVVFGISSGQPYNAASLDVGKQGTSVAIVQPGDVLTSSTVSYAVALFSVMNMLPLPRVGDRIQQAFVVIDPEAEDDSASCVLVVPEGVPRGEVSITGAAVWPSGPIHATSNVTVAFSANISSSPLPMISVVVFLVVLAGGLVYLVAWDYSRVNSEKRQRHELELAVEALQGSEYASVRR